jgi:hypothetical protein
MFHIPSSFVSSLVPQNNDRLASTFLKTELQVLPAVIIGCTGTSTTNRRNGTLLRRGMNNRGIMQSQYASSSCLLSYNEELGKYQV